jgi:hypothetical protein
LASASPDATRRLLLGVLAASALPGCTVQRALTAGLYSTDDFAPLPDEPRVRAEPGAEAFAHGVAPHVTPCVTKVETAHYRRFAQPVAIYVCASAHSFSVHSGASTVPKGAVNERLFLNPRLFETPERIPRILAHELSHLHLVQQLGVYRSHRNLPDWFKEGLAALVSDGGGVENVSADEARQALRAGLRIEPVERDGLFRRKTADYWFGDKIADPSKRQHMFYRQSMLFVGYLRSSDEVRFRQFLLSVQDGGDFTESVRVAYDKDLNELWQRFLDELPPV